MKPAAESTMNYSRGLFHGKTLFVIDLDDSIIDSKSFLVERGYDISTEEALIEAYLKAGYEILAAKPKEKAIQFVQETIPLFDESIVLTSRLSVPVNVTCTQVHRYIGTEIPIFLQINKAQFINRLGPKFALIFDDLHEQYEGLEVPHKLVHPEDLDRIPNFEEYVRLMLKDVR